MQASREVGAIHAAVLKAKGYRTHDVAVIATPLQLVVRVINSPLVTGPNAVREDKARRIVATIERTITARPESRGTVAVHVNYIARDAATGESRTIDGIDFRKDQLGRFRHHVT